MSLIAGRGSPTLVFTLRAYRSSALAGGPDLLRWPLPRPLRTHVPVEVVPLRIRARIHVDEALDLETVRMKQVDPRSVREVVLHPDLLGPFVAVETRQRTLQGLGDVADIRETEDRDVRIRHEHE